MVRLVKSISLNIHVSDSSVYFRTFFSSAPLIFYDLFYYRPHVKFNRLVFLPCWFRVIFNLMVLSVRGTLATESKSRLLP